MGQGDAMCEVLDSFPLLALKMEEGRLQIRKCKQPLEAKNSLQCTGGIK